MKVIKASRLSSRAVQGGTYLYIVETQASKACLGIFGVLIERIEWLDNLLGVFWMESRRLRDVGVVFPHSWDSILKKV